MLIPIVVVAAFLGIMTLVLLGGGDDDRGGTGTAAATEVLDPVAEALAVLPADAPLVGTVETDATAGPMAAALETLDRIPGSEFAVAQLTELLGGLDPEAELLPLLGNPFVFGLAEARAATGADDATPEDTASPTVPGLGALRAATVARDPDGLASLLEAQVSGGALQRGADTRGFTTYVRPDGGGYALRDATFVAAGSAADLDAALTLHARATRRGASADVDGSPALTPAGLRRAFAGLPSAQDAVLRVSGEPQVFGIASGLRADLPWVEALRRAAFAVAPGEEGVEVPFRLTTDPESITDGDVPIASGPAAPSPAAAEDAAVVVAFRDLAHTLAFARRALPSVAPDTAKDLDEIEQALRRFARVDPTTEIVQKLTGTTTISTTADGARTLRAELRDPEPVADALARVQNISQLGSLAGGIGIDVDTGGFEVEEEDGDGRYRILRDGDLLARAAVIDDALVLTDDEAVDLEEVAQALPESPPSGARGAFFARISAEAAGEAVIERFGLPGAARAVLGPFGDVTIRARGSTEAVTGSVTLPVR